MKTLKLKSSINGSVSLQHPQARPGISLGGAVITYVVTDIPDDVATADVQKDFETAFFVNPKTSNYTVPYDAIKGGCRVVM